jgi:hypothetical protein
MDYNLSIYNCQQAKDQTEAQLYKLKIVIEIFYRNHEKEEKMKIDAEEKDKEAERKFKKKCELRNSQNGNG